MNRLPDDLVGRLPKYPGMPAALIGRLAVDKSSQGFGFGGMLVINAIERAKKFANGIGIYGAMVEAIDGQAKRFYEKFGFRLLRNSDNCLFFPIK